MRYQDIVAGDGFMRARPSQARRIRWIPLLILASETGFRTDNKCKYGIHLDEDADIPLNVIYYILNDAALIRTSSRAHTY